MSTLRTELELAVIGLDLGEAESEAFWTELLRDLRRRGLQGVRLCVSDQQEGLGSAIARALACPWQRCTVHYADVGITSTSSATCSPASPSPRRASSRRWCARSSPSPTRARA